MRPLALLLPLTIIVSLPSCATLNDSMKLGAGVGTLTGVAATYAGYAAANRSPSFGNVAVSAGIGAGLGILTSYLIHKSVEETRQSYDADQTEMHFGDLPPSPFIFPKNLNRKGRH